MKKSIILLVVLVVVGLIIWKFNSKTYVQQIGDQSATSTLNLTTPLPTSAPVQASEKTKVSDKVSEYKNGELGFSVKYPTPWKIEESSSGITLNAPLDESSKNTVNKLESKIDVVSGKCAFPPVTTIKERTTAKFNGLSFNMISMSNSVQGRNYFNRMYTLEKDSICYVFSFASVTLSPSSKGLSGGQVQQVNVNNKAIVDSTDLQFKDMVKSFSFVVSPKGEDEATVYPKK